MNEIKKVEFNPEICDKIYEAIANILEGYCSRVDVSKNVKVYECKNVIRIDLKIAEDK